MDKTTLLLKIEKAANLYNKTKKDKYKKEWYKLVKRFSDWASYKYKNKK